MSESRVSEWRVIADELAAHGPSRSIDSRIHRLLGYDIKALRAVPKYCESFDACQRVLLQKGWAYVLSVRDGTAEVKISGDTFGRVIADDGPVTDIGLVTCTAMVRALDHEAKQ